MFQPDRRSFLKSSVAAALGGSAPAQVPVGERPMQAAGVKVELPRLRVPLSFIIDDSTCLVNMGHFCMPQFATAWPERAEYKKPWKTWPREIPDAFVREFGEWCAEQGVKGKYSVVPFPACVGRLDRELPGWSRQELLDSIRLVRELILPNWDIHPEMITHTRVIDLTTGHPLEAINAGTMENSYPQSPKSVDELAAYLAYALRILKNVGLPCEGITTPGGFGNRVKAELSLAVRQAVLDVFNPAIPHYFKYIADGKESTFPKLEHVRKVNGKYEFTVNVLAGTGDWFGGWDGVQQSEGHRYADEKAESGRMVELIERGEPAVMLCHWPGMYCNGSKEGFVDFKKVVTALARRYGTRTQWMKLSELARYQAAKELTTIEKSARGFVLDAPYACPDFTLRIASPKAGPIRVVHEKMSTELTEVQTARDLREGVFLRNKGEVVICFRLAAGSTTIPL